MAPLANAKVVVIGGTSGIGFAVARAALAEGAHVVACSSKADKVTSAVERLASERATGEVVDIASEDSVQALFAKVGKFDHLVITAVDLSRAAVYTSLASADIAELRGTLFDNRFWGALYCIKNAHGLLAEAGSITVTTGTVVKRGQKGFAFPAGAGGALAASVRTLAIDLAPVRVNVIGPGLVQTEMWASFPPAQKDAMIAKYSKELPVRHIGQPEELAEAYLFAMKCTYITGQEIYVDGGGLLV